MNRAASFFAVMPLIACVAGPAPTPNAPADTQAQTATSTQEAKKTTPPDQGVSPTWCQAKLQDRQGNAVEFCSLRRPVTLLAFGALYCKPCMMEMPLLQKLHQRLATENDVAFYVVNVDKSSERSVALRAIDKAGFFGPLVFDAKGVLASQLVQAAAAAGSSNTKNTSKKQANGAKTIDPNLSNGPKYSLPLLVLIDESGQVWKQEGLQIRAQEEFVEYHLGLIEHARQGKIEALRYKQKQERAKKIDKHKKGGVFRLKMGNIPPPLRPKIIQGIVRKLKDEYPHLKPAQIEVLRTEMETKIQQGEGAIELTIPAAE